MHEIRATIPNRCVSEAVRIAESAGILRLCITDVTLSGSIEKWNVVSAETSTPKAREFMDGLLASALIAKADTTITARELRAIVSMENTATVTRPMVEPAPDVIQDLWQLNHLTPSYFSRAAGGAILLADGILKKNYVSIVIAALFLPFLPQALATGFGFWTRDWRLMGHGLTALSVSTLLAICGGALVARIEGGPLLYDDFRSPLSSFCISGVIGITAGFCTADDAGRRYLIGVAGAVQLAVFPVWFGVTTVLGFPAQTIFATRLFSFAINLITICIAATVAYATLQSRQRKE